MKHVGHISKESMPQYAVPVITSKNGCKSNESVTNVSMCKAAVKKDGSYPLPPSS